MVNLLNIVMRTLARRQTLGCDPDHTRVILNNALLSTHFLFADNKRVRPSELAWARAHHNLREK
jgi:hypothetical protein